MVTDDDLAGKAAALAVDPAAFTRGVRGAEALEKEAEKPKAPPKQNPACGMGCSGPSAERCPNCDIRMIVTPAERTVCGLCGHGAS
jgi:hypothetical protein